MKRTEKDRTGSWKRTALKFRLSFNGKVVPCSLYVVQGARHDLLDVIMATFIRFSFCRKMSCNKKRSVNSKPVEPFPLQFLVRGACVLVTPQSFRRGLLASEFFHSSFIKSIPYLIPTSAITLICKIMWIFPGFILNLNGSISAEKMLHYFIMTILHSKM